MTPVEHKSVFNLAKDTPYLTLTGELWGVCCQIFFLENQPCFNSTMLYNYFFKKNIARVQLIIISFQENMDKLRHALTQGELKIEGIHTPLPEKPAANVNGTGKVSWQWGLNKMAVIWQTTFSNGLRWMTAVVFWFKFH